MTKVKVIVEGYVREEKDKFEATSTSTLIQYKGLNVIVDPGMDRELLLKGLRRENLSPEDIDYVILTHYHLDHSLLAGIFSNAEVLDDGEISSFQGEIRGHEGEVPGTDIKIIKTPGHARFHCSVLVDTEEKGTVAIAGDVIWWKDQEKRNRSEQGLMEREDPYVKDKEALNESRQKLLERADWIVPGHGDGFKLKKK